ncbi:hypothetical protein [Nitrosomonas communis]|uniref:hypothetical protein n=1 Tax=Nitrosomonas communis TaxID=44574 RepID=UPI0026F1C0B5|nr:hypothetical protein [Nitrosomonas communis]MCO6426990.1 hypothetical protein [Nitrosomonas communis]
MKDLRRRIEALEAGRSDPVNDFLHEMACRFCDRQGKPKPEKQDDVALTLRQLAGYLPS